MCFYFTEKLSFILAFVAPLHPRPKGVQAGTPPAHPKT